MRVEDVSIVSIDDPFALTKLAIGKFINNTIQREMTFLEREREKERTSSQILSTSLLFNNYIIRRSNQKMS